ncbi:MAG: isocitrate dehydrogenase kinase/phosphatase AceK regulatory subunit [Burkholderiaceae bacterium]
MAGTILAGFARHYGLFRYHAQLAKARFEAGDFHAIRRLASERISFYDQRVLEAVERLLTEFHADAQSEAIWQEVKRHYVGLLGRSAQPALAETFFNSVCCKILHRTYFNNDFIFVRPAVAADYLDAETPSFRAYYPLQQGWRDAVRDMIADFGLACPFVDVERDIELLIDAAREYLGNDFESSADCQLQVLHTLFFRNKGAYIIGRLINDGEIMPFSLPILRDRSGRVYLDAALFGSDQIESLFNFSRAYFMVDMEVPSAYVRFCAR